MLVAGNQNAKAQHFQKVKMELLQVQQRVFQLEKDKEAAQEQDKEALKLATNCFTDFEKLSAVLGNPIALSAPEKLKMQQGQPIFSTTGYALTKLLEGVRGAQKSKV